MPGSHCSAPLPGGSVLRRFDPAAKKDLAAAVRQRLLNQARAQGRPFGEVLQYFAMERLLYRLSRSPFAQGFILKGALMLLVWEAPVSRPTMDIDLLGSLDNSVSTVEETFRVICRQEVEPDGLVWLADEIGSQEILEGASYRGVRLRLRALLGSARVTVQVDIGFGDPVVPEPVQVQVPTHLGFPPPVLLGTSRETAIAEKFDAMVRLGTANSRMKDFFDVWLLAERYDFEAETLSGAIAATLEWRGTALATSPVVLDSDFAQRSLGEREWKAFLRRARIDEAPSSFEDVLAIQRRFLGPLVEALLTKRLFQGVWTAPGPWIAR